MKRIFLLVFAAVMLLLLVAGCSQSSGKLYFSADGTYYRGTDGENVTGFVEIDDNMYFFGEDGKMVKEGIVEFNGAYYMIENEIMVTGWRTVEKDGSTLTYYFGAEGRAVTGEQTIEGKLYNFGEDGALIGGGEPPEITESTQADTTGSTQDTEASETTQSTEAETSTEATEDVQTAGKPSESLAVGQTTGNERLDDEVKKIIDEVCDPDKDAVYNLGELFDWMVEELKYKYVTVDLSNGYTEELISEIAEYLIINRRGSCENQAALMCVFIRRMGYDAQVVAGEFLSDDKTEWVEHAWVIANIEGEYYHFDPLYGRNHTGGHPRTFFMQKDADIEDVHRWDREAYPACE